MKKTCLFLTLLLLVSLACDMSVTIVPTAQAPLPTNTMIPAATSAPTQVATSAVTSDPGVQISVDPVSIVLSPGLAAGARGIQVPGAEGEDVAPWDVAPPHVEFQLEGYVLQNRLHEPRIYVFPAVQYAEMRPVAFESMLRLDNISGHPELPLSNDELPLVPFFSAQPVFASQIQRLSFPNGQGVRFLTEYAQYAASVNNHDMFYQYQGLTDDGAYYIIAIFPISAPLLAETSDAGAVLPTGGIPYPYLADPSADMQSYYVAVTNLLNTASPDLFTPTLHQLDTLIQSIRIR